MGLQKAVLSQQKKEKNKMKILVVCQYYYPEPFRISDICEELVRRGHEVAVVTGVPNYPEGVIYTDYRMGKKREEIIRGVNVHRCFTIGRRTGTLFRFLNYYSFAMSSTLYVSRIKKQFDVVFVNQLSPVMMACAGICAKKKWNIPLVLYCLDLWPESLVAGGVSEKSLVYKLFKRISKQIYSCADVIAITSKQFKNYFEDVLNVPTTNMVHLSQYAEEIFCQVSSERIKKDRYDFVFAGNIGEMQAVETIIRAAALLEKEKLGSEIKIHIVGDGTKLNQCKDLALGSGNIEFYGRRPVEDMPKFYEMADAMLLTLKDNETISYTLPGKMQSYMAAGKPIIGSINGEAKSVIEDAKCGYCCSAEDSVALANLMKRFVDSEEKQHMGLRAKQYYDKYYRKSIFMERLEQLLFSCVATTNKESE